MIIVFRKPQLSDPNMSQVKTVSSFTTCTPDTHLNFFAEYSQQDATFLNLFISVRRSTCFRRFFRPSSGAQNCTDSVRYWSDKYLTLYVQFWAPGDGRKSRLKHVERLTEINKLWNVASCWLYCAKVSLSPGIKLCSILAIKTRNLLLINRICN